LRSGGGQLPMRVYLVRCDQDRTGRWGLEKITPTGSWRK